MWVLLIIHAFDITFFFCPHYSLKTKDPKYVTIYEGTSEALTGNLGRRANYLANKLANKPIYGDAIYETSKADTVDASNNETYSTGASWNGDYSLFPYASGPFFLRGGHFNDGGYAGVFCFGGYHGSGYAHVGFRAVAL